MGARMFPDIPRKIVDGSSMINQKKDNEKQSFDDISTVASTNTPDIPSPLNFNTTANSNANITSPSFIPEWMSPQSSVSSNNTLDTLSPISSSKATRTILK